jgi:hypothetical protein
MIITREEIIEAELLLERVARWVVTEKDEDFPSEVEFFVNRPHLLMPLGYDEFRSVSLDDSGEPSQDPFAAGIGESLTDGAWAFPREMFYRNIKTGAWEWFEGITQFPKEKQRPDAWYKSDGKPYLHLVGSHHTHNLLPAKVWLKQLENITSNPGAQPYSLVIPSIWAPRNQLLQYEALDTATRHLLQALYNEKLDLRSISWRQLEEIVAELLRSLGLQVFVTPRGHDGGRDVIARGELIPGEPTLLSVEVKQKPTVGIYDVQRALRANEDQPALLVATAGRFSGGVIREKSRERNQYRLFLKDGIALRQWIDSYGRRNQWERR